MIVVRSLLGDCLHDTKYVRFVASNLVCWLMDGRMPDKRRPADLVVVHACHMDTSKLPVLVISTVVLLPLVSIPCEEDIAVILHSLSGPSFPWRIPEDRSAFLHFNYQKGGFGFDGLKGYSFQFRRAFEWGLDVLTYYKSFSGINTACVLILSLLL